MEISGLIINKQLIMFSSRFHRNQSNCDLNVNCNVIRFFSSGCVGDTLETTASYSNEAVKHETSLRVPTIENISTRNVIARKRFL